MKRKLLSIALTLSILGTAITGCGNASASGNKEAEVETIQEDEVATTDDASSEDAERLIEIYNAAFYSDYLRYGTCPGYGLTKELMEESIRRLEDWKRLTLVTPIDKTENVKFYTEKCGFQMVSAEMDSNVKLARFVLERKVRSC